MAQSFSANEAKQIIEQYRSDCEILKEAIDFPNRLEQEIETSSNQMIQKEVRKVLQSVPLEELNREKKGMRLRALKENGYTTIAQVSVLSAKELEDINGIGRQGAQEIYEAVREMIAQTARNTRIRLNYDEQNETSSSLVRSIFCYRSLEGMDSIASSIWSAYGNEIQTNLEEIAERTNSLKWLFTSRAKKNAAMDAYAQLEVLLDTKHPYRKGIVQLERKIAQMQQITTREAWNDFQQNSIAYTNVLETLLPGMLEEGSNYGLPEEIARQIQGQPFVLDGLHCQLRRYQEFGVKYILHQENVLLGDEMGLGKTVQAIAAMVALRNSGERHFLVVCPASVLSNWCREIKKHSDLAAYRIHGKERFGALQDWLVHGGVGVTTYETTSSIALNEEFRIGMLIVDEAHYIKNPSAKRTMNVASIAQHAERKLFMTGTALENNVQEMVRLIAMLQPEVAQSVQHLTYLGSAPQFQRNIASVYYRRKREDVLTELPELIEEEEWCQLNEVEEELYETAVNSGKFNETRRVSWNVEDLRDSSKAMRMLELILEAEAEGRKILVFSFFLDTLEKVCHLLQDRCVSPITGSVPVQRRQEIIDEFEQSPSGTVLCAQIQAGGTGLNIQSASVVILCEPQLKPSIENQAISRAYRMGQARNVLVYRLLCDDTIDERIMEMLDQKQEIFDAFADEALAANENMEIDSTAMNHLMEEERKRIQAKKGVS